MADEERVYWIGFHRAPYIGPMRIQRLLEAFGSLRAAWHAPVSQLRAVLDERSVESLAQTRATLALEKEIERLDKLGVRVVTLADADYPPLLAQIPSPPPVLYVRGSLQPDDATAVAIVGTRRATAGGREIASRLARELAEAGVTIVSGLARGIDGVAHQAALDAGGRTLAVLGSGVNVIYPPEHRQLAQRIVDAGALISDYPPDTQPDAVNFPPRNRIISGLSLGVVIVEAPEKSGALITCDFAADQGREVFVVPGSVLSHATQGSNRLLRDGARVVLSAEDVLEDLQLLRRREQTAVQQALPMTDDERRVLALLTAEPQHIDDLAAAANLEISAASALLTMMELKGVVRNAGAQHYVRV
ncbi:MAG: DNA-protecting protein DprA [Chloroflexota bacterium]